MGVSTELQNLIIISRSTLLGSLVWIETVRLKREACHVPAISVRRALAHETSPGQGLGTGSPFDVADNLHGQSRRQQARELDGNPLVAELEEFGYHHARAGLRLVRDCEVSLTWEGLGSVVLRVFRIWHRHNVTPYQGGPLS